MAQAGYQLRDWHAPVDLQPAKFTYHPEPQVHTDILEKRIPAETSNNHTYSPESARAVDTSGLSSPAEHASAHQNSSPRFNASLIDKVIPIIGKLNNGGLDITSVLDLLDKSGQGFGALGKLLPIITPLMQNGTFNNLFNKKKPVEDTIDYRTMNLDN